MSEFKKISKIPALLNTSLNLHGDPKASDIKSVIKTFLNSDLDYLYLEDKYLIKKRMSKVSIVPKLDFKGPNVIKGINLEGLIALVSHYEFVKKYYSEGGND